MLHKCFLRLESQKRMRGQWYFSKCLSDAVTFTSTFAVCSCSVCCLFWPVCFVCLQKIETRAPWRRSITRPPFSYFGLLSWFLSHQLVSLKKIFCTLTLLIITKSPHFVLAQVYHGLFRLLGKTLFPIHFEQLGNSTRVPELTLPHSKKLQNLKPKSTVIISFSY